MNAFFHNAVAALGFRQKAYQSAFSGSHMHMVLVDLAKYSHAFDADLNLSPDQLMTMHGRRQMFFRIIKHLKLSPNDLEQVYQPALVSAATRLQQHGVNDDE